MDEAESVGSVSVSLDAAAEGRNMESKALMCVAITVVVLCSGAALAQSPSDDPFHGGFSLNYKAEVFTMGAQNDSLHSWAFEWLTAEDTLILMGEGSFPESYQCGDNRDIALGDFDGTGQDEVVIAWDRADGGVFVGIPTIDPVIFEPDPAGWHLPDVPIASGVLYATPVLSDVLGEIRVVAGNFYDDYAKEFVLAYLAADSTITLTVFDIDAETTTPVQMASISDQAVYTSLPALQQFGVVSRFDVATGDFDGDGLDEIALIVSDPAQSPATDLVLKIYDYDPLSHTLIPESSIPYAANTDVNHSCLRRVLMETGNFEPDSLDEIAILDHWSRADVDSSRVGTLHTLKLDAAMTGLAASQQQALPPCSWGERGGVNGGVDAMTTYNGELIVGGAFDYAGYVAANNIASWDGVRWKPLGSGVNGGVDAMAVYEGDLIVGGYFHQAGGVNADHLARWDGSTWEEFGGGIVGDEPSGEHLKKILPSEYNPSQLFVGGRFISIGGVSANNIAWWDGSTWHAIGSGTSGFSETVMDIVEVGNSDITVVGAFTHAGGVAVNYIARRANNTWSAYGSGLNWPANSVIYRPSEDMLVVTGLFTTAGGSAANYVAYWRNGAWSAVGSPGLNGAGKSLCIDPVGDEDFYVGGTFTTAGGISANNIVRRDVGVAWQPLGGGLTYPSGTASVGALYYHDGDLIAGGSFDHADNSIHARGIARWDGSDWHAFPSQNMLPVGLAVGRFNGDSELDDIAITACRMVSGYFMQYLGVYGVDTLSPPLTLCQKWNENISQFWSIEGLARSRRLIAIGDITGNGQPDMAVLCAQSSNNRRIYVYEPTVDALNNCTFASMPYPETWDSWSDNMTALVLADLDTTTVTIGPPRAYHVDSLIQATAIIYAPPVHYDILNDTTWDVSNRYPLPPADPYDTYVQYYNSTGFTVTTVTETHRDWGISDSLAAWINAGGSGIDAYLTSEYGEHFSIKNGYSEQITVGHLITARDDDQLHAFKVSHDILEYPVLHGGRRVGHILVVTPSLLSGGWDVAGSYKSFMPNHEVENILSYLRFEDIPVNPMKASGIIGNTSDFFTMQPGSGSEWFLSQQRFTESSVDSSWDASLAAGGSVTLGVEFETTAEVSIPVFGGLAASATTNYSAGTSVGIDGYYDVGQISTYSTSFSSTDSLHVQMGLINSAGDYSGNRRYKLIPYAYWANNGALVIDYAVEPEKSQQGEPDTWWQIHYSQPDPAFILPGRFNNEKYGSQDPEELRHESKEIYFFPEFPSPGDSMVIGARVHNFSLADIFNPVAVSFYLGDPDNGGVILTDKNSGESIFYTRDTSGVLVGIGAQRSAFTAMVWQVPDVGGISSCQRIWAVIDPLDEISPEVHDNGDWATNNKGWNLLRVNTDDICIDTDGDGWADPAFRCNMCPFEFDNCPAVYNPDQTDANGDGIGDACQYVCGDANGDKSANVGDAVFLISYVFKGGAAPVPLCAGDANGDGGTNVGDAVYMISYVFKGGMPPVESCCP